MSQQPTMQDALNLLDERIQATLAHFANLDNSNLVELLKSFGQLKEYNDRLKDLADEVDRLYRKYSYEVIPDVMEANKVDSIRVDGKNFINSTRINASIPEDQRDAGHRWIIDVAKVPELIVPRVNSQSLSAFVKQYFEINATWPPEDAIKVHKQNYIQVRSR